MWILPTRARPENLARFFVAWEATRGMTKGVAIIDEDDPKLDEYFRIPLPGHWKLYVGKRRRFDRLYNDFLKANPALDWYGFLADDVVPVTPGWDTRLVSLASRDGLAYADDGLNGERHAAHFVLGGDLVRATGWLLLPGLDRLYGDTAWNEIARARGVMRYAPDVLLEHRHFANGRAPMDETYRKPSAKRDQKRYIEWRQACSL